MMDRRDDLLAELGRDASLERSEFLVRAGEQLDRFLRENRDRIRDLGGLVLLDDDHDYLSIAPDGSFRSRTRVLDEATGEWESETEIIETGGELVELYNPADLYTAFSEAVLRGGGAPGDDAEADDADADAAGDAGDRDGGWRTPEAGPGPTVTSEAEAAAALYELALDFQERSQTVEADLLTRFEAAATTLLDRLPPIVIVDDLDEHLEIGRRGFEGRVIPEGETSWTDLVRADGIVRFYDPTDIFGDLADAVAEAWPDVARDAGA